ncbi:putative T7SS-secreted protein [Actinocrispum wychmicini]|uniref:Putative T7SS secretion signal domain-containing protein n=1 Tax=Actinocrispum wychmicini TaxID=1213861 RepID=A0A4R2JRU2_9PSEU|nr:hypothetical protein [Actinocrispum wychmicini]TCO62993.1 hypothetical protein EV192_1021137 [Actinocrispum wychmicini]
MAELGETQNPKELVPGDVGSVTSTMYAMRSYGDALHEAGAGLSRIDTQDGWQGQAGDQFRGRFHGEPKKWLDAGDCFHGAANALDSYASTLQWAQGQAGDAITLWNDGQTETANAKAAHDHAVAQAKQDAADKTANGTPTTAPDIPFNDPGEAKREAARQKLNSARSQLKSTGDTAEKSRPSPQASPARRRTG